MAKLDEPNGGASIARLPITKHDWFRMGQPILRAARFI